ncbi:MAG TPA: M14 family zinc carboxypeptidase [Solirubrobacteraceae bacterium]|jgi:hypothetical protein
MRLRPAALLVALAALAGSLAATTAQGADAPSSAFRETLTTTGTAATTQCAVKRLAGRSGVVTRTWTPTAGVSLHAALTGADGSDWDLAVFDRRTGRRLGGSSAWNANEVVTAIAAAGQPLEIQACRIRGARTAQLEIATTVLPVTDAAKLPVPPKMVEIALPTRQSLGFVQSLGIDTVDSPHAHGIEALIYSNDELRLLKAAGLKYTVRIDDLRKFDQRQARLNARYTQRVGRAGSPIPSGRTEYRQYEDYLADLKTLAEQYPAIVRPVTLPHKTFQGREQVGVEIAADVNRADDQRPVSFLMGTHHAREWPAAELTMEMALYLAQEFGKSEQVTELLRHVRVVVVPIINPDGFVSSRTAVDPADESGDPLAAPSLAESVAIGGSLAYRRKNCKGPGGPSAPCDFNNGVDPNRNYGHGWGGIGASTTPTSQSYRGPGPWSEEETQSVHEYSQKRDVTSLLTMHNFGSLVLRPPGRHNDGLAPDEERLKQLGDAMERDTGYTSQYGWQLYDTSGTTEDWNYGAAGTFGYTMELGPPDSDGGNFHITYDRGVVEQWVGTGDREGKGVRRALLRVIEEAATRQDFSTLIGRAPAGRILRLKKDFTTLTSAVCRIASPSDVRPNLPFDDPSACIDPGDPIEIPDGLEYTTRVPANSVFSWIVTPSTRPFEYKAGKTESWKLTCEDDAGTVYESHDITMWRGELRSLEMPCGGTLPTSGPGSFTPQSFEQAQEILLVDRSAPQTTFAKRFTMVSRRRIVLGGGSRDSAPEGLIPRVAEVRITIARRTRKKCRFLDDQGRFSKRTSCAKAPYTLARVRRPARASRWTYSIGTRLPKGRYFAFVRGMDAVGNLETKDPNRNVLKFRIR